MATPLRMPDMGTVEGEVTLVRWLKAEGDAVTLGEPLFEVETDKGVSEVEAALAGILEQKLAAEGARVGSGETIALIRRPGESAGTSAVPTHDASAPQRPPLAAERPAAAQAGPSAALPRMPVAPTIRALAEKWGVDLSSVPASGPGGRITREDVLRARGAAAAAPEATGAAAAAAPAPRVSAAQAAVARTVSLSHRDKPTYHVHARADMTKAIAHRESAKAGPAGGGISWDAILVKAVAVALTGEPLFRRADRTAIDVAVALGVGDDLFVAAVRSPAGKTTAAISRDIDALAKKAEARELGPRDVEGSCFLVSNLGMFDIESFDAIIHPDHAAALAVGAVAPTPVSDGRNIRSAPMASLTLSVDHRFINGRTAARFLARLKQILDSGAFA